MPLQKQPVNINFAQGLDTKTDPFQVSPGKFLSLSNTVFTKGGQLTKRNGYGFLTPLPNDNATLLTTFDGNLTAVGTTLQAYTAGLETWTTKGQIQPVQLNTLPLIRSNTNQSQLDSVVSVNNLTCTVYTDNISNGTTTTPSYRYVVADAITGQNIVPPTVIPNASGSARVFILGNNFIIVFTATISSLPHLQYMAIPIYNPTNVIAPADISTTYTPASTVNFDAIVANNALYVAWNGSDVGGAIHVTYISSTLVVQAPVSYSGHSATLMSVTADTTGSLPIIYASFYDSGSSTGYTLAVSSNLATILAPTSIITATAVDNIVSTAQNGLCTILYEVDNNYSYDSSIPTHYIDKITVTQSGTVSSPVVLVRSVGLASKAFILNGAPYVLAIYYSVFQPTYFLLDQNGKVVAKLAYGNAGPYYTLGLPSVTVTGTIAQIGYLFKDLIQAVNKTQGSATPQGIYSQLGLNLATFDLTTTNIITSEIGSDLHITGGFLWMYDGFEPVEHLFFLWPDNVEVGTTAGGGSITAQEYFYQVTYEWSDNQGNMFRSAPSIPVSVTATGGSSRNQLSIPMLRLTYKITNPVKIVIYRWSTAQQIYYQVTSIQVPQVNDPTTDYLVYIDSLADSSIIGNNILYTTGGVLENIQAPATNIMTLFQSRLWLVDAEDQNLLWFSKEVIEATPVETSDLLTIYVAPTTGAQGSTGVITALAPMDDKLIIFKKDALTYINGIGPDNTGANSQYSDPILVTSTVGCTNEHSIVFMPQGLMFQSDKGIWLLGRDLATQYIGAPVEQYTTSALVQSAVNVPGTNQVRFTLDSGITLMYDYYYSQWGTFTDVPAITSTLYEGLHTYLNQYGQVLQETPGSYIDGSSPVLMSFTTGWMNLAGLQGFERFYYFLLLGTYITPFKLNVGLGYDYIPSVQQSIMVTPINQYLTWGSDNLWGGSGTWGGNANLSANILEARIFPQIQKCKSFQITITEIYDSSFGVPAGAGLTLSGINMVVGAKRGFRTQRADRSYG